jgi:hypothetical protein
VNFPLEREELIGSLSTDEPLYIYPDSLLDVEYPDFDIILFPKQFEEYPIYEII